ncbi:MAG: hypothetical protein LiPW41_746 [Parcubacteria group bacterium LiPW_41]|nr:MAG: hypothetical protein LiPW41_746 [Parcubacteria group bacterium LiPW_41]
MNEEKNNNQESCCSFCKGGKMMCGNQGMHMHKGCHIVRWVLAILILWAVFMGGVKIGELKGMIDGDGFRGSRHMYGSQMMRSGYGLRNQQDSGCIYMNKTPTASGIEETTIPGRGKNAPDGQFLQ